MSYSQARGFGLNEKIASFTPSNIRVSPTTFDLNDQMILPLFKQVFVNPYLQQLNDQCAEEIRQSIKTHSIEEIR